VRGRDRGVATLHRYALPIPLTRNRPTAPEREPERPSAESEMRSKLKLYKISADLTIPVKDVKTEQVLQLLNKYC